jgi:N6-L-threonylcarbamoyladenine synthase
LYFIRNEISKDADFISKNINDICASIQKRIVSILLNKLKKASEQTGIKDICVAGGVSANSGLRAALTETGMREGWRTFIPAFEYCTDNAAMIAITGYYKYLSGEKDPLDIRISARADWG